MRPRSLLLILVIGLGLILGACSGAASSPGASAGGESTAAEASTPAAQSQAATESEAPAESQAAAESQSAGGEGGAPTISDGPWTGGQGQVTVGGAVSSATDEPISTDVSDTVDEDTLLAYNSDDTFVTIRFILTGQPYFYASVTAPRFAASSEGCDVTWNTASDTEIDATFSCVADRFAWFGADEEPTGEVTIEGSFTATR